MLDTGEQSTNIGSVEELVGKLQITELSQKEKDMLPLSILLCEYILNKNLTH